MKRMTSQELPINVPSKNRASLLRLATRMAEEAELIGGRMAELREQLDLTQREVAEALPGSTQGSDVSRWETGKHRPAQETLPHIAKILKTTVADLHLGPMAKRKPKKDDDLMEALSKSSDLPDAVAAAVEALRLEVVATRTQLLAEVGKVQAALKAQPSTRSKAGQR
jgi:transcriptional regulator with XRE-family HTH domain